MLRTRGVIRRVVIMFSYCVTEEGCYKEGLLCYQGGVLYKEGCYKRLQL